MDIQTEEERISSVRSRTSFYGGPLSEHDHAPIRNPNNRFTTTEEINLYIPTDYRRFEWYWILVLVMISSVSAIVISTLVPPGQVIQFFEEIPYTVSIMLTFFLGYTGTFVLLSIFHETTEKTLEQYCRISRQRQRILLKVLAWSCPPFVLLSTVALTSIIILVP